MKILEHGVAYISRDGQIRDQFWFYEALKDHPDMDGRILHGLKVLARRERSGGRKRGVDLFHANSVLELPQDVEGLGQRGDLLVSFRHLSMVAVLRAEGPQLVWSWGSDVLTRQHDATLTEDGKVILFDNRTRNVGSRVLIVDPLSKEIVREIGGEQAPAPLRFFSAGRGLAQALPGGNVLVVASNEGRTFEVTQTGDVVWEFWSPWIRRNARLPIRAIRLHGPVQTGIEQILAGTRSPPKVGVPVAGSD